MTTPAQLADLIVRCAGDDSRERLQLISLKAALSADDRDVWLKLRASPPAFVSAVAVNYEGTDDPLEEQSDAGADTRFDIVVNKAAAAGELRVFFVSALAEALEVVPHVAHVRIAALQADQTFSTCAARFEAWTADPPAAFAALEPLPDPRRFSTDFTNRRVVPNDLRPWLLRAAPAQASEAFATWRALAVQRLMAALANQVSEEGGSLRFRFSGPPTRTARFDADLPEELFERLDASLQWAFCQGRDVETRHLLLSSEWARTWREEAPDRFGTGALESARSAYDAYVKSGSKETLKALTELRRAVSEESQRAAQRAQDLTSALWKDLAIATAPFILKLFPDASKFSKPLVTGLFALAAALFIAFSFACQAYVNRRYFERQERTRAYWRRALNTALTEEEIATMSDQPIRESERDYGRIRTAVGLVYLFLVGVLMAFALVNLQA